MTPEEEIKLLRKRIGNQRRELRRLNRHLGPYWSGFSKGLSMENECRLRGVMNSAFGHERVRAAEMAAAERRNIKAAVEPDSVPKPGFFQRLREAL